MATSDPGNYWSCEVTYQSGWIQTFPTPHGGEVIAACDAVGDAEFGYPSLPRPGDDETGNDFGNFELIDQDRHKYED